MNILFNFIPIKEGGGQQVASNFVHQLLSMEGMNPIFIATEGTFIHKKIEELRFSTIYVVSKSLIKRLYFERYELKEIVRRNNIDLIYTMFGPGLRCKGVLTVTGCAYSNIFFPEIDFWKDYNFSQRLRRKLADIYRLKSTLKSDAIVFENKAMLHRAVTLFNYPKDLTKLILPSVTDYEELEYPSEINNRLKIINKSHFNILMLSGWAKNKNIQMVPNILKELHKKGLQKVTFIITVDPNHFDSQKLYKKAQEYDVQKHMIFFNSVLPQEIPFLYKNNDAVMLLSQLESFSNNIIESWFFQKPLIISDAEWSKTICRDAAIYVNRDNAEDIAEKIENLMQSNEVKNRIVTNGLANLLEYPNPREKVIQQISFLQEINKRNSNVF